MKQLTFARSAGLVSLTVGLTTTCLAQEKQPQPEREPIVIQRGDVAKAGRPLLKSPDGKLVVKTDGSTARLCDSSTGKPISRGLEHGRCAHDERIELDVICWSFSPDGKLIAIGAGTPARSDECEGIVRIWNVETGELVKSCGVRTGQRIGRVTALAFSKDGKTVVYKASEYERDSP